MDQILIEAYDDGLLITVNGRAYKKVMSPLSMLWLSQQMLGRVSHAKKDCLMYHEDEIWQDENKNQVSQQSDMCSAKCAESTTTHLKEHGLSTDMEQFSATEAAMTTVSIKGGSLRNIIKGLEIPEPSQGGGSFKTRGRSTKNPFVHQMEVGDCYVCDTPKEWESVRQTMRYYKIPCVTRKLENGWHIWRTG